MTYLKNIVIFSCICLLLVICFNTLGYFIIEFLSNILCNGKPCYFINEYSLGEDIIAGIFYVVIIFVFTLIGGIKYSNYYIPVIYLICCILFIDYKNVWDYDAIFLLNFGFTRIADLIYSIIRQLGLLGNDIIDIIVFNAVFFIYQFFLLLLTKKIYFTYCRKKKNHEKQYLCK